MATVSVIFAQDVNGAIGYRGTHPLPWHRPEDLRRFKELTMGKPLIMGAATFKSLPGILPGRPHYVLSRKGLTVQPDWEGKVVVCSGLMEALLAASKGHNEVFIIGGAELINTALDFADRVYRTTVLDVAPLEGDVAQVRQYSKIDRVWWHYRRISNERYPAEGRTTLFFEVFERHTEE